MTQQVFDCDDVRHLIFSFVYPVRIQKGHLCLLSYTQKSFLSQQPSHLFTEYPVVLTKISQYLNGIQLNVQLGPQLMNMYPKTRCMYHLYPQKDPITFRCIGHI